MARHQQRAQGIRHHQHAVIFDPALPGKPFGMSGKSVSGQRKRFFGHGRRDQGLRISVLDAAHACFQRFKMAANAGFF